MKFKQISIDLDVHKEIELRRESFDDSPNDVLRKVFKLIISRHPEKKPEISSQIFRAPSALALKGATLKEGLLLRKYAKGTLHQAIIKNGKIEYNGRVYHSPSAAAWAVTKSSTNGWIFWEYFDAESSDWKILDNLRSKQKLIRSSSPSKNTPSITYSELSGLELMNSGNAPEIDFTKSYYTSDVLLLIAAKLLGITPSIEVHRYSLFTCVQSHLAAKTEEPLQGTIERSIYWDSVSKGSGMYTINELGVELYNSFPFQQKSMPLLNSVYTFRRRFKDYTFEIRVDPVLKQLTPSLKQKPLNSMEIVSFLDGLDVTWQINSSTSTTKIWNWIIQDANYTWERSNR